MSCLFQNSRISSFQKTKKRSRDLAENLFAGDAYVLKDAFPVDFLNNIREKAFSWGQASEPHFEPMVDGCNDQHRIIDLEISKKYTYTAVRHSHFFFPWNDDPAGVFEEVNKRWRVFKYLGGFPRDVYENNIPSTGPVDRIQIARYPAGGGGLDAHQDPYKNQKCIIGGMMSKKESITKPVESTAMAQRRTYQPRRVYRCGRYDVLLSNRHSWG